MLIGIYSSVPQSGKSTVADHLVVRHGFKRRPFAAVLKEMMRPVLYALGVDLMKLYVGDKAVKLHEGKTLRHALQTLGTEWGRKCMGDDFWVEVWKPGTIQDLADGHRVVVDDMRFPNEFAAVLDLGGRTWKVERPGACAPTNGHASEGALDGMGFDAEIVNYGTLKDLEDTVENALNTEARRRVD
jgi:hypothetical protein